MTGTLKSAGFDVFNLANNHALDYGSEGQAETVSALDTQGLRHTGRPGEIAFVERKGVRIAILGFAPYKWASPLLNVEEASAEIATAADQADVVVVLIHAGAEGADKAHVPHGDESMMGEDRGNSREFARAAFNAGADLVLGSGPHVLRGIERVGSGLVAYSAGDFSGYNNFGTHDALGLSGIFKFNVAKSGKVATGRFVSVRLSKAGVPYVDSSGAAGRFVSKLSSEDFGANGVKVGSTGALRIN
jgi:hypothetical protein